MFILRRVAAFCVLFTVAVIALPQRSTAQDSNQAPSLGDAARQQRELKEQQARTAGSEPTETHGAKGLAEVSRELRDKKYQVVRTTLQDSAKLFSSIDEVLGFASHDSGLARRTAVNHQLVSWRNLPSVAWLTTTNNYDDLGNLLTAQDPGLHTVTFSYSDSWSGTGCSVGSYTRAFVTQTSAPDTTNQQGNTVHHRSQTTYFPCTGLKQSTRDENDILASRTGTQYAYDQMHRPVSVSGLLMVE